MSRRLAMSFFFCCATLVALVSAQEAPKALPCSLPAPTATTPAVKGTEAWTATGGNEVSKLSDMAALSFENWLKSGAEGAASADAAAAACTSKNVAKYTIDVKSACKRVADAASETADASAAGGGMEYALQYEVSYSCRARGGPSKSSPSSSSLLAAKKSNASAPSSALAAAAAAPAAAAAAPLSGPVKVEATLRTLVSQPPLKESADGSLVRPKPLAKETWFVEGTTETSSVVEKTVKKSLGGTTANAAAGSAAVAGAPSSAIISTQEKEVAPVGSALAEAFSGGKSGGSSSSSSLSETISSMGAALASALDAAAGADGRVGDALDAAVADYRDSYYGGAPRGGAVIITSPVGFTGNDGGGNPFFAAADDETAGGDFDGSAGDESDFTTAGGSLRPAASTMSTSSSSSIKMPMQRGGEQHESAAEEGKRVAREAASSAANVLAAARPE